ncbi:hypothetical protein BVI434_4100002 [Burkholderia vietnamiensis]|nr:hypothetical protein BVI434_4100002 [Burkholderia vietnamiensis]
MIAAAGSEPGHAAQSLARAALAARRMRSTCVELLHAERLRPVPSASPRSARSHRLAFPSP